MTDMLNRITARLQEVTATKAVTLAEVNRALRKAGIKDKLVKGKGYFYFLGEASDWPDSSVHVYNVDDLSLEQWVSEYERLKKEADPDLQDRLNQERYGRKR